MLFAPHNFLYMVKQIVTGGGLDHSNMKANDGGFFKDEDITPLLNGSTLNSTGVTTLGTICLPRDYDSASDILQLHLTGSTNAGSTQTFVVGLTGVSIPGSSSIVATKGPKSTTFIFTQSTGCEEINIDLSGFGLTRGTTFSTVISTASNGCSFLVKGGVLVINSCLVAYDGKSYETVGSTQQQIRG